MAVEQQTSVTQQPRPERPQRPGRDGPVDEGGNTTTNRAPGPTSTSAPTVEDTTHFDPLRFNDFLTGLSPDAMALITGGAGGGSSSTSSSGGGGGDIGGGGGGGLRGSRDHLEGRSLVVDPEMQATLNEMIMADLQDDDEAKQAIIEGRDLAEIQGQEAFDERSQDAALAAFGQGREGGSLAARYQSEIAMDEALYMASLEQQMWADLAALDQQQELQRQNAWATVLGLQTQLDTATIGANAQITSSEIQANAQVKSARISAQAQVKSASISASASRYASKNSLIADIYGIEAQQEMFGAELEHKYYDTDTGAQVARDQMEMDRRIAKQNRSAARQNAIIGAVGTVLGGPMSFLN